jgi:hypothetical protein
MQLANQQPYKNNQLTALQESNHTPAKTSQVITFNNQPANSLMQIASQHPYSVQQSSQQTC